MKNCLRWLQMKKEVEHGIRIHHTLESCLAPGLVALWIFVCLELQPEEV